MHLCSGQIYSQLASESIGCYTSSVPARCGARRADSDTLTGDGCHERQQVYDPELPTLLCDVLTTLSRLNDGP